MGKRTSGAPSSPRQGVELIRHLEQWRRRGRSSSQILQALGQVISDGLVLTDSSRRVAWLNPAAQRLTALTPAQAAGLRLEDLIQPISDDGTAAGAPRFRVRRADERPGQEVVVTELPLYEGDEFLGTAHVLVRAERSGLVAQNERWATLIAGLSHEIRTPLAATVAALELLEGSPASSETSELVQRTRRSILWVHSIVENLLAAASFQAGRAQVSPKPTRLRDIVGETLTFVEPLLARKDQILLVEGLGDEILVLADSRRIQQVLVNLITNAVKYGPPAQAIRLRVALEGGHARISVIDEGPGIPLADQPYLFDRFFRTESARAQEPSGAGLGLAVVRTIVEAHGGKVGVRSLPGHGASFWFTLPLADAVRGPGAEQ